MILKIKHERTEMDIIFIVNFIFRCKYFVLCKYFFIFFILFDLDLNFKTFHKYMISVTFVLEEKYEFNIKHKKAEIYTRNYEFLSFF